MCLILTGTAAKVSTAMRTNVAMTESIFDYNADGLGAMYRNRKGLRIVKVLPRDMKDVMDFLASLPADDRNLAVHWRMRTHGHTDIANCHPHDVVPGEVAMMHNGILATGNAADPSKSDTYHFIQDFLADAVAAAPAVVHSPGFLKLVGEFIDNNRFVFMDKDGQMSIVNKDQGIEHDGIWFANTYAWDPATFVPGFRSRYTAYKTWKGAGSNWPNDDAYDSWWEKTYRNRGATTGALTIIGQDKGKVSKPRFDDDAFFESLDRSETEVVTDFLEVVPDVAINALFKERRPKLARFCKNEKFGKSDQAIVDALLASDLKSAIAAAELAPASVSHVMCYYLDWLEAEPSTEDVEPEEEQEYDKPMARYMGLDIYVYRNDAERESYGEYYEYLVTTPDGVEVDTDWGFTSAEQARDVAMAALDADGRFEPPGSGLEEDTILTSDDMH
jgi:hypothetical protein